MNRRKLLSIFAATPLAALIPASGNSSGVIIEGIQIDVSNNVDFSQINSAMAEYQKWIGSEIGRIHSAKITELAISSFSISDNPRLP